MLVVFGGLPGTGKTTLARGLAATRSFVYLRIDEIEQAMRGALGPGAEIGPAGYAVAFALAESNLALGRMVVADCVNPVAGSRRAWQTAAARTGAALLEIEVVCSDPAEHRRRVEGRTSDIAGLAPPSWDQVRRRAYEPWETERLVVDTARLSPADALRLVERHLRERAPAQA